MEISYLVMIFLKLFFHHQKKKKDYLLLPLLFNILEVLNSAIGQEKTLKIHGLGRNR